MMMPSSSPKFILHKLKTGLRCRCPACEQGRLFESRFLLNDTCPYCEVRFERGSGDAVGAVYINIALAELSALTGFFVTHALFALPMLVQLMIWLPFVLVFCVLAYRPTRGLWVAIVYLGGGLYADPDYTREYIAPSVQPRDHAPYESQEDN